MEHSVVTFSNVVGCDLPWIKLIQQTKAAETEDYLLREAIALVASVQGVSKTAVIFRVFGEIGVQQIDRDGVAADSGNRVLPCAHCDRTPLDFHHYLGLCGSQLI